MKTLSFYLVLLSLTVIGCQKDIDEPSALSAKNDKNCNCNKARYLPIKVEERGIVYTFNYLNDEGDLSEIKKDGPNFNDGTKWKFNYKNGFISEIIQSYDDSNSGPDKITVQYTNSNLLTEVDFLSLHCYEDPYWPSDDPHTVCEYESSLKYQFIWGNGKLKTYKRGSDLFNITYENNLLTSIERYPKINYYGDTRRLYYLTDKNYWAKDIKNKELLFTLSLGILPIEKDLTKIIASFVKQDGSIIEEPAVFVSKYNNDGYPVEIKVSATIFNIDDNTTNTNTYTRKITYKKIILK